MKIPPLLCVATLMLGGCSPGHHEMAQSAIPPGAAVSPSASAAGASSADSAAASYEVSIASAEADRVRAQELCDSKGKAERPACMDAADTAYTQAKTAADSARDKTP